MPYPYSSDLRERIIDRYQQGNVTHDDLAKIYDVSKGFVQKLLYRYKQTGKIKAEKVGGFVNPKLDPTNKEFICHIINENPSLTLQEIRDKYE